jgi:AcrR family transcriptional regulator
MATTRAAAMRARPEGYAKSRTTKAQILAAALAEASARGLHNTSVSRIAARANTAVGSLNYHFGTRKELLREMMRLLMVDLGARLAAADADAVGDGFFERHRAELLAYVQYVRANPAHVRLADEIKFLEPDLYRRGVTDWVELVSAKLRAGIADGSVRPMEETEIAAQAHFLLGARQFLEDLVGQVGRDEEVVDSYLRLVRGGLGASPAPTPSTRGERAR